MAGKFGGIDLETGSWDDRDADRYGDKDLFSIRMEEAEKRRSELRADVAAKGRMPQGGWAKEAANAAKERDNFDSRDNILTERIAALRADRRREVADAVEKLQQYDRAVREARIWTDIAGKELAARPTSKDFSEYFENADRAKVRAAELLKEFSEHSASKEAVEELRQDAEGLSANEAYELKTIDVVIADSNRLGRRDIKHTLEAIRDHDIAESDRDFFRKAADSEPDADREAVYKSAADKAEEKREEKQDQVLSSPCREEAYAYLESGDVMRGSEHETYVPKETGGVDTGPRGIAARIEWTREREAKQEREKASNAARASSPERAAVEDATDRVTQQPAIIDIIRKEDFGAEDLAMAHDSSEAGDYDDGTDAEEAQYQRDIEAWEENGIAEAEARIEREAAEKATATEENPAVETGRKSRRFTPDQDYTDWLNKAPPVQDRQTANEPPGETKSRLDRQNDGQLAELEKTNPDFVEEYRRRQGKLTPRDTARLDAVSKPGNDTPADDDQEQDDRSSRLTARDIARLAAVKKPVSTDGDSDGHGEV